MRAEFVENAQQQVRHWRMRRISQMASAFYPSRGAADQKDRQRVVIVFVSIAERAAEQNQRVVEKRAVAIRSLFELVEEVGERADVIPVQHGELIHVLPVVRVMRCIMETVADAALRVNGSAGLVR